MRKIWFHLVLLFLISASPSLSAFASTPSKVTFLGANPQFITPSPVAISSLSGGGIDAAGNGYFADENAGRILFVTPTGTVTALLGGLKQPRMAVDYRGDVFVSDTGNNRVLSLAAGASEPVVRATIPAPGSIAVDVSHNFFFLSGNFLYEVSGGGQARKIGEFPGASLIAYGPAVNENDTIYILSNAATQTVPGAVSVGIGTRYSVSTYTYHNATGTVAAVRSFQTTEKIEDFAVDTAGNLVFAGVGMSSKGQPQTSLFEITTIGDNLALTSPVNGTNIRLALDYNRSIYYTDAQGLFKLMKGAIDFGSASQEGGSGDPSILTLNFSLPTGVAVASTSYTVDGVPSYDFEDGFPFDANCSAGALCSLSVSYLPLNLGVTAATMSLLDASGNALVQIQLHGVGIYPMHEIFAANGVATSYSPTAASLKAPAGICDSIALGPLVTDVALGTVVTPYSSAVNMSGLGKPETVAHVPAGDIYTTQAGLAGVLAIHSDSTRSRIAERLVTEPNGVGVDGAGNLYISDHSSIFRVGVDGTETQLAYPSTDEGYETVESIAVDPTGIVYAFFKAGGPEGTGGLLKITPSGTFSVLPTTARGASGLALDSGGGLYFSDGVSRSLETQRTDGTWMTLLSGLKQPRGVTALFGPLLVDQGTAQLLGPTLPQALFDFGNVPVGTTAIKQFTIFALGNAESTGELAFDGTDSAFSGSGYRIDPGASQTVTISFTPTFPGPHNVQLYDEANDYFADNPILGEYTITGVGIEPQIVTRPIVAH